MCVRERVQLRALTVWLALASLALAGQLAWLRLSGSRQRATCNLQLPLVVSVGRKCTVAKVVKQ